MVKKQDIIQLDVEKTFFIEKNAEFICKGVFMYQHFNFEKRDNLIVGYSFPCENPNHVMCIIHGIGEHAGRYDRMAEKLKQENIAVLSMDLRGHGKSKGVRGHAAPRKEILKDIDALLSYSQEMYPNVPIVLYGHSMGGNIVLDYRSRGEKNNLPVAYIVSAPWIELVRKVSTPQYYAVKVASKFMPRFTISSGCVEEDLGNLEYVKPYKESPLVHDKVSLLCAYEGFSIGRALASGTLENNGGSKGKPFLLMHGTADKICSIEGTRRLAKMMECDQNFTYVEWPGHCHEIHNGGKEATGDQVIKKIIEFVKNA